MSYGIYICNNNVPCSTVKVFPFKPRPLMRSPSGKGRSLPPSKMALKSYKDSIEHALIMRFYSSMTFKMFREEAKAYSVVFGVPIASQNSEFSSRSRKGDRNYRAALNFEATEATGGLVEGQRGEVKVATDLIFHLQDISEILSWWDGAVCAINTILPRVSSLLNPIPTQQHQGGK